MKGLPTPPPKFFEGVFRMSVNPCEFIVVDDHEVIRLGLKAIMSSHNHLKCVGWAGNGNEAFNLACRVRPQVVVMDMRMPQCDGMEATRLLAKHVPEAKVVAFSVRRSPSAVVAALRAGAKAYVSKNSPPRVLIEAITSVAQGKRFIDPSLADPVITTLLNENATDMTANLSAREREVLVRIAEGYTASDVASGLGLSVKTVECYKARACQKLGLECRSDIVKFALMSGWLYDFADC